MNAHLICRYDILSSAVNFTALGKLSPAHPLIANTERVGKTSNERLIDQQTQAT